MLYVTLKDNLSIVFVVVAVIVALWYYSRKEHFEDGSSDSIQSHSQLLFKSMNDISKNLRVELDRTKVINDHLIETSETNSRNLTTVMTGSKIGENSRDNIDVNIARGRGHVDDVLTLTTVAQSVWDIYNVNPQQILNDYQFGNKMLRTYIEKMVNDFLSRGKISLEDSERIRLYAIVFNAYIKFMDTRGVNKDISRLYADTSMYVKDSGSLETLMNNTVQNILNEQNKRVSLSAKNPPPTFKIGEFVFFKHVITVTERSRDVCADDDKTNTLVVGGKICRIDSVRKTAKLKYSFVMNPNYNQRCTQFESSSGKIDYSKVDTYPVWYMKCDEEEYNDCCDAPNVPKMYKNKFSCDITHMKRDVADMPNNFMKTYIGGHGKGKFRRNGFVKYSCGVSPTGYDFPSDVSLSRLFRTIEDCLVGKEAEYEIPVADTQRV